MRRRRCRMASGRGASFKWLGGAAADASSRKMRASRASRASRAATHLFDTSKRARGWRATAKWTRSSPRRSARNGGIARGIAFPGHSEVMAKIGRSRNWRMMFAGSELRLALVTVHVGLAKVPRLLSQKNVFDTIVILDRHLRENEGAVSPRIGVLGFNPHAGENGLFGDEEIRIIAPAIRARTQTRHRCVRAARARHRIRAPRRSFRLRRGCDDVSRSGLDRAQDAGV